MPNVVLLLIHKWIKNIKDALTSFLAVQDSSIGDIVSESVSQWVSESLLILAFYNDFIDNNDFNDNND